jgi:hypothetical protein
MPQYYSGNGNAMGNGMNNYNMGYTSPYGNYSQYGANYQVQSTMQQNPYMMMGR